MSKSDTKSDRRFDRQINPGKINLLKKLPNVAIKTRAEW